MTKVGTPANIPCRGAEGPCGSTEDVRWESSRTQYYWDKSKTDIDPNRPIAFCKECAQNHHEYWGEMWAEYYAGLL